MTRDPRHHRIVLWTAIGRSATDLARTRADDRATTFSKASLVLGATCLYVGHRPDAGNWLAAIEDVLALGPGLQNAREVAPGLELSTPVGVLKDQVDSAYAEAGVVVGVPTALDDESRTIALNLAGNWALKLLVALALEPGAPPAQRRVARIVRPLVGARGRHAQ